MQKCNKLPVARKKSVSSRALAYAILRDVVGVKKSEARRRAGFTPRGYDPEKTEGYKSIQERIESACELVGVCVEANAATLGEIAYSREAQDHDRISAVNAINKMTGWQAPERIDVEHSTSNILVMVNAAREQGVSLGELIRQARARELVE